ncbi:hypothetical protein [Terasakiella sp.]|uniref:hypothetical protein n=1 Tax=Terasakiella sp. TaxID=2034861 RepID=UPI003AA8C78C
MKRSSLFALAIAATTALSFGAQAGSVIEYSDTWKPGFEYDDGTNQYTRMKYVEEDTGYYPDSKMMTVTKTSSTPKPGYTPDDNGSYYKVVQVPNPKYGTDLVRKGPHEQKEWAADHSYDDGKDVYYKN